MVAQLAKRRARIAAGEKPIGWKVGLGAPATMLKMGLSAPIVGFLMERAQLPSSGTASLKGYSRPVAEPEICVRMAARPAARRFSRSGCGCGQRDTSGD